VGRKPRTEVPGGIYHVIARRVDRWPLFVDDEDYERYVALLAKSVDLFNWLCLSFCLMPNHVHLLIEIREPNLAKGMHRLQGMYVRWFNDRHGREGRLFEHRYRAELVDDDLYFTNVAGYIALNPVKAMLCRRPEEWRWSSRGIVSTGRCPSWLADVELLSRLEEISGRGDFFDLIVM
jgi:REP-associated tyrosine transposase